MTTEDRNNPLLSRRQFNGLCASLPAVATLSGVPALAAAEGARRSVKLPNGTVVSALGQGSWHLGQDRHPAAEEEEALRTGLSLGMTLIDTAEIYGGGRSEQLIGRVIAGQRDRVFVVSKVPPYHTGGDGAARACEASLSRLGTDHLDLYLLHWRGGENLPGVVAAFEALRAAGKIRAWGVSNFRVADMEELFRIPNGDHCAANQVLYNAQTRGIERDLLPWCEQHGVPIMAYTPLGNGLVKDPTFAKIGAAHGCSAAAAAIAWTMRGGNVISIPESGSPAHVKENAVALSLALTPEELQAVDAAHA
ncbi:MAG TPA: aldo/keto reductase [Xanthobacteraceae bacterium]|nr:aldo/keto reductase [Xanthobacteraceae bacterium]